MFLHYQIRKITDDIHNTLSVVKENLLSIPKVSAQWWSQLLSARAGTTTDITTVAEEPLPIGFKNPFERETIDRMPLCMLNGEGRIDYMLQESMLENTNTYVAALGAHSNYFDNKDVAKYVHPLCMRCVQFISYCRFVLERIFS